MEDALISKEWAKAPIERRFHNGKPYTFEEFKRQPHYSADIWLKADEAPAQRRWAPPPAATSPVTSAHHAGCEGSAWSGGAAPPPGAHHPVSCGDETSSDDDAVSAPPGVAPSAFWPPPLKISKALDGGVIDRVSREQALEILRGVFDVNSDDKNWVNTWLGGMHEHVARATLNEVRRLASLARKHSSKILSNLQKDNLEIEDLDKKDAQKTLRDMFGDTDWVDGLTTGEARDILMNACGLEDACHRDACHRKLEKEESPSHF